MPRSGSPSWPPPLTRRFRLDQVDVASVFHFWINFGLWTSIALGVGFALFAVKTMTYNPYRAQAVKLDTAIALRESRLMALSAQGDEDMTARRLQQGEANGDLRLLPTDVR